MFRHPDQVISRKAQKATERLYEAVEVPGSKRFTTLFQKEQGEPQEVRTAYSGVAIAPSVPVSAEGDRPARPKELKGRWDRYTLERVLSETESTRLWLAKNTNGESVWVKEYHLSERDFKLEEIKKRRIAFERIITLNLKLGYGPDFRLVRLIEAIANPDSSSCYLITKPIEQSLSLDTYLAAAKGAMTAAQIREVLRQVLETLRFLHTAYRVRFSADQFERGVPHGNLTLQSLYLKQTNAFGVSENRQFFIYASDLMLWEHLFRYKSAIAQTSQELGSVRQDLQALGRIGFYVTGGKEETVGAQTHDFAAETTWSHLSDRALKEFIQRLLGVGAEFSSAEDALHALPPLSFSSTSLVASEPDVKAEKAARSGLAVLGIGALALCMLGGVGWAIGLLWQQKVLMPPNQTKIPCCINPVETTALIGDGIPYVVESGGAWESALQRTVISADFTQTNHKSNLLSELEKHGIKLKPSVIQFDRETIDRHELSKQRLPIAERRQAIIAQLLAGEPTIAFMRLGDDLPKDKLASQLIAYDALVVFVAFSDVNRQGSIPKLLNGQITWEQLRQLYRGKLQTLNGKAVKLYFPTDNQGVMDQTTIDLFQNFVFGQDKAQTEQFQQQLQASLSPNIAAQQRQGRKKIANNIYAKILDDAENQLPATISIGFDRMSRMFGQCSVYPLAIVKDNTAVQLLVQANDQPINPQDATLDLCKDKGSYWVNVNVLKSQAYPMAYALGVVFPQNLQVGKALADRLNTIEGQYLLSQVGLVPQQPLPELWNTLWSNKHD